MFQVTGSHENQRMRNQCSASGAVTLADGGNQCDAVNHTDHTVFGVKHVDRFFCLTLRGSIQRKQLPEIVGRNYLHDRDIVIM